MKVALYQSVCPHAAVPVLDVVEAACERCGQGGQPAREQGLELVDEQHGRRALASAGEDLPDPALARPQLAPSHLAEPHVQQ